VYVKNKKLISVMSNREKGIVVLLLFLIVLSLIGSYWFIKRDRNRMVQDLSVKTTSTAPTAQADFTDGNERSQNTTNPDKGNVNVEDNQGSIPQNISSNQPLTSEDKQISVLSPQRSQVLMNGDQIAGNTNIGSIQYRIIDSISGVIASGTLQVVNSKFSAKLTFTSNAKEGRIDIFSVQDDGRETSSVEIPVRFK
jgi:type II secretory pathway pseudopilin PulG